MYKLYEYRQDDVKIGVIISDTEQCLYIGNKLYSARTNKTPYKQFLHSAGLRLFVFDWSGRLWKKRRLSRCR